MPLNYYGQQSKKNTTIAEQESLLNTLAGDTWKGAKGLGTSLLWLLSRPFSAVSGAVSGTIDDPGVGTLKGLYGGLTGGAGGIGEKYSDVYFGDILGKMGVEKGDPIAPELPWFLGDITARDIPAGLMNVFFDPLMYVGVGELSAAGKVASKLGKAFEEGGLAATKAMQFTKAQRIAFNFKIPGLMNKPYEFDIINRIMNKPSIWLAEKAGNLRSSKVWEGMFGTATDDIFKGLQKQAKAGERAYAEKYIPSIKFIDETIDNMAKTMNKDRSYIEKKIIEYVEDPILKMSKRNDATKEFGDKFLDAVGEIDAINAQLIFAEKIVGIKISELGTGRADQYYDYIARAATPELREVLLAIKKKTTRGTVYTNTDLLLSALPRDDFLRNMTLSEANAALKKYYKLEGDAFFIDPALIMASRVKKSAKAVHGSEFLNKVMELYGIPVNASVKPGMLNITDQFKHLGKRWHRVANPYLREMFKDLKAGGWLPERLKHVKDFEQILFPEKIAMAIDDVSPLYTQGVNPILNILDKYNTHLFKPWVTVVSPAYGVRNLIDDSIRAWMGGLNLTKKEGWMAYKEAGAIIGRKALDGKYISKNGLLKAKSLLNNLEKDGMSKIKWGDLVPGLNINYGQLEKELGRNGIVGGGFLDSNIYRAIDKALKVDGKAIMRKQVNKGLAFKSGDFVVAAFDPSRNIWMKGLKKINTTREDLTRSALYIAKRKEGYSELSATKIVNKYLYDYENLGVGDKFIRNLIPFWSFTRQNVPMWTSMIAEKPIAFSMINKLLPQAEDIINIPEFMQEGIPIQISKDGKGKKSYLYSFGLSFEELNKITTLKPFRTVEKFFLSSLSPLIKYPFEEAVDRNFYFSTKLSSGYSKAYSVLKYLPDSLKNYISLKEKTKKDGTIYYRVDPRALHVISNSPFARIYSMFGKSFDEDRTWYDKMSNVFMGFRTGIVDLEEERKRKIKRGIRSFLSRAEVEGEPVKSMELLYIPKEERDLASPELKRAVELFQKKVGRVK